MDQSSSLEASSHFLCGKTILVSGAGIAGLTFAIALAQQFSDETFSAAKPKVIIFERDSYEERMGREGYTLSLRTENNTGGGQVLDYLGLYERVRSVSVNVDDRAEERGCFNIWNPNFRPFLRVASAPVGPKGLLGMRIRRNALQKILAEAAAESGAEIHWETALNDAQLTEEGNIRVSLSNGSVALADILIAADGSRSRLRSLLKPNNNLDYAGVYCCSGIAKYAGRDAIPKPVDRDWGAVVGTKDGVGLFVSPVDDKSALWNISRRSPERKAPLRYPISQKELDGLMKESLGLAANFAPLVKDLISATDPSTVMLFSAMDRMPFSHLPLENGPVIWIGDANHAVSPFAGAGANLALMDARDLAKALRNGSDLEQALVAYDNVAIPRAGAVLKYSRWSIDMIHATGIKLFLYKMVLRVLGLLNWKAPTK